MMDMFGEPEPEGEPSRDPDFQVDDEARVILGDRLTDLQEAIRSLSALFPSFRLTVAAGEGWKDISIVLRPETATRHARVRITAEEPMTERMDRTRPQFDRRRGRAHLSAQLRLELMKCACEAMRRICPMRDPWQRLFDLIRREGQQNLEPPLILGAWDNSRDFEKRDRFISHLAAAAERPALIGRVEAFIEGISDEDWHSTPSAIQPAQIAAYRLTEYRVEGPHGPFVLRIDEWSRPLTRLMSEAQVQTAMFITAYNPFSELVGEAANLEAHERLRQELQRRSKPLFEGAGVDPTGDWTEEKSFLVLGVSFDEARELGTLFRQNAVVWAGADAVPRLVLLR